MYLFSLNKGRKKGQRTDAHPPYLLMLLSAEKYTEKKLRIASKTGFSWCILFSNKGRVIKSMFSKPCPMRLLSLGFGSCLPAADVGKPQTSQPAPQKREVKGKRVGNAGKATIEHHLGRKNYYRPTLV